jgi:hypothetical protein
MRQVVRPKVRHSAAFLREGVRNNLSVMNVSPGVVAARLRAQLLVPPGAGQVEQVVDRLLAVQAQDARAFRLALRARSHGTSARDVETALSERRTLVVSWLFEGRSTW